MSLQNIISRQKKKWNVYLKRTISLHSSYLSMWVKILSHHQIGQDIDAKFQNQTTIPPSNNCNRTSGNFSSISSYYQSTMKLWVSTIKKLDRLGKDHPHDFALRRNLSETGRKNPVPWPHPIGPHHNLGRQPLLLPQVRLHRYHKPAPCHYFLGEAQRVLFWVQVGPAGWYQYSVTNHHTTSVFAWISTICV
jgi:hypothetical protein